MWQEEALMHIIETVQEWKNGVIERTGIMVGLALTRTHDNFIEYLVCMDETTTFKEFKGQSNFIHGTSCNGSQRCL